MIYFLIGISTGIIRIENLRRRDILLEDLKLFARAGVLRRRTKY